MSSWRRSVPIIISYNLIYSNKNFTKSFQICNFYVKMSMERTDYIGLRALHTEVRIRCRQIWRQFLWSQIFTNHLRLVFVIVSLTDLVNWFHNYCCGNCFHNFFLSLRCTEALLLKWFTLLFNAQKSLRIKQQQIPVQKRINETQLFLFL